MDPRLIFYVNLVLCVVVFLELLFTFRNNLLLKVCFLLIISALFVMNFYALTGVSTRFEVIFVKSARLAYVCSTLLAIVHLVSPRIPKLVIALVIIATITVTGIRVYYFNQIDIEKISQLPNQVFSLGPETYYPKYGARYIVFAFAITGIAIAYAYYRRYFMRVDFGSERFSTLSRWIISLVIPLFLLIIFGIMGAMRLFSETTSSYLFAFFSWTILFSFLTRPGLLNREFRNQWT